MNDATQAVEEQLAANIASAFFHLSQCATNLGGATSRFAAHPLLHAFAVATDRYQQAVKARVKHLEETYS